VVCIIDWENSKVIVYRRSKLERQDIGDFIVTNQHVYFSGPIKSLRIRLKKIVSIQGYSDGIRMVREAANPKPLVIKLDDPWFASNLILRLGAI